MAAQIRVLRRRIKSTQSIKKITRAMELIATSRIAKARARVDESRPYAEQITAVLAQLAQRAALDHPLLVERENTKKAAVLVVTSDRGQAGGYNNNVLKEAEALQRLLRDQGKEPVALRHRPQGRELLPVPQAARSPRRGRASPSSPRYANAAEVTRTLVAAFMAGAGERDEEAAVEEAGAEPRRSSPWTSCTWCTRGSRTWSPRRPAPGGWRRSRSSTSTRTRSPASASTPRTTSSTAPSPDEGVHRLYEFEPSADTLFDALLPKYIGARLFSALLESAASESAARQRAMKAATDNANELIRSLTLEANQARQAQITQEISEIVGGADALVERRE